MAIDKEELKRKAKVFGKAAAVFSLICIYEIAVYAILLSASIGLGVLLDTVTEDIIVGKLHACYVSYGPMYLLFIFIIAYSYLHRNYVRPEANHRFYKMKIHSAGYKRPYLTFAALSLIAVLLIYLEFYTRHFSNENYTNETSKGKENWSNSGTWIFLISVTYLQYIFSRYVVDNIGSVLSIVKFDPEIKPWYLCALWSMIYFCVQIILTYFYGAPLIVTVYILQSTAKALSLIIAIMLAICLGIAGAFIELNNKPLPDLEAHPRKYLLFQYARLGVLNLILFPTIPLWLFNKDANSPSYKNSETDFLCFASNVSICFMIGVKCVLSLRVGLDDYNDAVSTTSSSSSGDNTDQDKSSWLSKTFSMASIKSTKTKAAANKVRTVSKLIKKKRDKKEKVEADVSEPPDISGAVASVAQIRNQIRSSLSFISALTSGTKDKKKKTKVAPSNVTFKLDDNASKKV